MTTGYKVNLPRYQQNLSSRSLENLYTLYQLCTTPALQLQDLYFYKIWRITTLLPRTDTLKNFITASDQDIIFQSRITCSPNPENTTFGCTSPETTSDVATVVIDVVDIVVTVVVVTKKNATCSPSTSKRDVVMEPVRLMGCSGQRIKSKQRLSKRTTCRESENTA